MSPVQFDDQGNPVYPDWTSDELDTLAQQIQMLDPDKEGIPMNRLRVFYPKLGWNDIQKGLSQLEAAGRLSSRMVKTPGAKVQFQHWTWQEVA
jgi:hypothetical protein